MVECVVLGTLVHAITRMEFPSHWVGSPQKWPHFRSRHAMPLQLSDRTEKEKGARIPLVRGTLGALTWMVVDRRFTKRLLTVVVPLVTFTTYTPAPSSVTGTLILFRPLVNARFSFITMRPLRSVMLMRTLPFIVLVKDTFSSLFTGFGQVVISVKTGF